MGRSYLWEGGPRPAFGLARTWLAAPYDLQTTGWDISQGWAAGGVFSTPHDMHFCIEALEEALDRHGRPEIFNTDQGSQFTSADFINVLKNAGIAISMDGKGAWRENVFVERLWRTVKY